jgi:hypothetical protein
MFAAADVTFLALALLAWVLRDAAEPPPLEE